MAALPHVAKILWRSKNRFETLMGMRHGDPRHTNRGGRTDLLCSNAPSPIMPTMIGPLPVLHFLYRDRGVGKKLIALLALGCGTGHVRTAEPMAPVQPGLAFVDVSIVPMDADRVLEHQTVLIRGDRIAALGPVASTRVPDGATRIDGHGKWLMPGLVDMHVHLDDADDGTLYVGHTPDAGHAR
jgi:hypothetical protein